MYVSASDDQIAAELQDPSFSQLKDLVKGSHLKVEKADINALIIILLDLKANNGAQTSKMENYRFIW